MVISSIAAPDRLARLARLEAAELVGVLVEDVRDLEQREAAGLGRREAPRLERGLRRVDRAVHVRLARGRDVRDHGAVGRVLDRERLAGGRVDPLPADELLVRLDSIERLGHGRPPGRARALSARGVGCVRRLCATPRGRSSGDRPARRPPLDSRRRRSLSASQTPANAGRIAPIAVSRSSLASASRSTSSRSRSANASSRALGVVAGPVEPAIDRSLHASRGPAGTARTPRASRPPPPASRPR